MKNRATSLAAALILTATAASAQLFPTSNGTGPTFNSSSNNPFAATSPANSDPDWIFKCGTPPYLACTPAEITRRDAVKNNQFCPTVPPTAKCTEFIMRNGDSNPMGNYAAQTAPDGFKWANPDCTRIPCQITPTTTAPKPGEKTVAREGEPGFIGPPDLRGPQPFTDDAAFKAAMTSQEETTPGKVIDLGNRQYAVDIGGGQYSVGGQIRGRTVGGTPVPAAQIPGLQAAIDKKAAQDKLVADTNAANENMFTGSSAGGNQNRTAATPGGGRDDGAAVDGVQRELGGGGTGSGGPTTASSGGGSGSTGGGSSGGVTSTGGGNDDIKVKVKHGEVMATGTTFVLNQNMEKIINGAEKTYKNGNMTSFSVDGEVGGTVTGRPADPPVDAKYLGKQQWAAQSDAKK